MICDVHAHCLPQEYFKLLKTQGAAPPPMPPGLAVGAPPPLGDAPEELAQRMAQMEAAGVGRQYLSHGPFHPYRAAKADAVSAARLANDCYACRCKEFSGRLQGFMALPLPHIEESLKEIEYGFDALKLAGVTVNTTINDVSIADERFDPIFAELNRREAVLFIHPSANCLCTPLIRDFGLASLAPPLEDTVVALQLIVRKVPQRYPKVRIIIAHLGGALPLLVERIDHQLPGRHPDLGEAPSATLRRFYYDTVGHGSNRALKAACEVYGADRLLLGSDFPFQNRHGGYESTVDYIRSAGLEPPIVEQILHGNAAKLFASAV